jgi:hypothetical protein
MIFYLSGEEHKDNFEKIKDREVLTIEIRANLIKDEVIRFIKRDLRNIKIKCLMIDSQILDINHNSYAVLKEILEVFFVLNPDSRCILYTSGDHRQLAEEFEGLLLVLCYQDVDVDMVLDFINGKAINNLIPRDNAEDSREVEPIVINTVSKEDRPKGTMKKNRDKRVKQTTASNQDTEEIITHTETAAQKDENEIPDGERTVIEQIPSADVMYMTKTDPAQLYSLASKPNKISEGLSIKKRIQKAKDEKMALKSMDNNVVDINRYAAGYKDQAKQYQGKWSCSNIIIGVIGTERKVGATTACLKLALQLSNAGATVSYSEANSHNHLEVLAREFKLQAFENHYMFHSIQMYRDAAFDVDAGMNFILLDLGCMIDNDQKISRIIQELVDHVIVVSGKRGHEQKALLYTLSLLPEKEVSILFNYVREEEVIGLASKYKDLAVKVSYIPYHPDFDQSGSWEEDYLSIFDKYHLDKKIVEIKSK